MPLRCLLEGMSHVQHFESAQARETICKPIGKPSFVNPQGSDKAGRPARLNGAVNRVNRPACSTASLPSMVGAAMGVVGVIRKS